MPQIFPAWMSSPLFTYGVPAVFALAFLWLLITRDWRGLRQYLFIMAILALVGFTAFNAWMKYIFADFHFQFPPSIVIVQPVAEKTFEDRIEAIGTTQANESTALTSNVTETVQKIFFEEGQFVAKGTPLVQLHDAEEQASLVETEKAYDRSSALSRSGALSTARADSDRARLDIAKAQIDDRKIVAPFDGYLGLRSISVGDIVNPGTVITTIDDIDPIKIEFSVPEVYLAVLRSGLEVRARSEAYGDEAFTGTILAVAPRVDPVTRTIQVKATIANPDGRLRAGMLMKVEVVRNTRQNLAVSEEALVSNGAQKLVMVAGKPDKDGLADVTPHPVTIGARQPGFVEVLSGLNAGDPVILNVMKAYPGAKVKIGETKAIEQTVKDATANAVPGKQDDLRDLGEPPTNDGATNAVEAVDPAPAASE